VKEECRLTSPARQSLLRYRKIVLFESLNAYQFGTEGQNNWTIATHGVHVTFLHDLKRVFVQYGPLWGSAEP
jgi:hypothetical protein